MGPALRAAALGGGPHGGEPAPAPERQSPLRRVWIDAPPAAAPSPALGGEGPRGSCRCCACSWRRGRRTRRAASPPARCEASLSIRRRSTPPRPPTRPPRRSSGAVRHAGGAGRAAAARPGSAERWTVSADQRVYTFVLRPGREVPQRPGAEWRRDRRSSPSSAPPAASGPGRREDQPGGRPPLSSRAGRASRALRVVAGRAAAVVELTASRGPRPPFLPCLRVAYDAVVHRAAREEKDTSPPEGPGFASRPVGTGAFRLRGVGGGTTAW